VIISAGFFPGKGFSTPAVVPAGTGPVKLNPEKGGLLQLSIGTVQGADSYEYIILPGSGWCRYGHYR